jgi:hypothetical protein
MSTSSQLFVRFQLWVERMLRRRQAKGAKSTPECLCAVLLVPNIILKKGRVQLYYCATIQVSESRRPRSDSEGEVSTSRKMQRMISGIHVLL